MPVADRSTTRRLRKPKASLPKANGLTDRERRILDAAVELFHDQGYTETSVAEVAEAAGLLKSSLYHYIDSKEDLLLRIVEDVHASISAIAKEAETRDDLTPLGRIAFYVRRQVLFTTANVKEQAVYFAAVERLDPERARTIARQRSSHRRQITRLIAAAQEQGEIPAAVSPELAMRAVLAQIAWIHTWYGKGRRPAPTELADNLAAFVVNGLCGQLVPPPTADG